MRQALTLNLSRIASVLLLLALWQAASALQLVNPVLFPAPLEVARALWDYLRRGDGPADLAASLVRVAIGFTAGGIAGIVVGLYTGARPLIGALVAPALQLLRPIPPIAFVPVVIVWFGLTETGKLFIVFWGVFFTVWLSAHLGAQRVNENFIRAGQSLGMGGGALLWRVRLPAAAPVIVVGLRTAVGVSFYTLVAAELAGAYAGIAYRMEINQQNMQIGHTLAGLVLIGLISAGADKLFQLGARRLVHWSA